MTGFYKFIFQLHFRGELSKHWTYIVEEKIMLNRDVELTCQSSHVHHSLITMHTKYITIQFRMSDSVI